MTPELQDALRRIEALEQAVRAMQQQLSSPKRQQIALPLDLASVQVVKDALIQAGFNYP